MAPIGVMSQLRPPLPGRSSTRRGCDTVSPMDTHAAVRMLTVAGADKTLAVAVVDVAQNAAADHGRELATRSDLDHLGEVQRADPLGCRPHATDKS